MALEDGGRIDFTRLRHDRTALLLDGMAAAGIDVLVLGRGGNVRYAAGARQLWRAGTSPFAPMCVVVGATAQVHLLSVWDEGVPPEIGHENLYGLFWNPANLLEALAAIPGLADARRVGTDALTSHFTRTAGALFEKAELLDAGPLLAAARSTKMPDEVACITMAVSLAEAGLSELEEALAAGITERQLLARYYQRIAELGAPAPPSESVVFATPRDRPVKVRHLASDRPVRDGELVVLAPGALYAGYEGALARTRLVGTGPVSGLGALWDRARKGIDALVSTCRAGRTGADLYRSWEAIGEPVPPLALAQGLGIGAEPPVIGFGRGADAVLCHDQVLSVQSWVTADGTGGILLRETVLVAADGPQVLSRAEGSPS